MKIGCLKMRFMKYSLIAYWIHFPRYKLGKIRLSVSY
jgi:hypothetical protein